MAAHSDGAAGLNPFMAWAFLHALEESGSVVRRKGV
jgi:predicted N-acyltransferase